MGVSLSFCHWSTFNHQPHPTLEGYLQGETPLCFCFHNVFSRRVEDVSTTCTTKQAQHCGTVQFARFTFFLFFSPPLHSGPFRASCRGPPGTKMEEQEHELQNLNSAIAAKVHTAVSLDGDHHLGSLLVFCGICHEPSCFFLHICRLTT